MVPLHFDESAVMADVTAMIEAECKNADPSSQRMMRTVLLPFYRWHVGELNRGGTIEEMQKPIVALMANVIGTFASGITEDEKQFDHGVIAMVMANVMMTLKEMATSHETITHYPVEGGHA